MIVGNLYSVVRYFEEILATAQTEKIVVDRGNVKMLVRTVKTTPGYNRDRKVFRALRDA